MDTRLEHFSVLDRSDTKIVATGDGAAPAGFAEGSRPKVRGKFLYWEGRKRYIRGVTYGTFRPNDDGEPFPDRRTTLRDLGLIAASGFNTVRTYTPPPEWLLDGMQEFGLRAMVGLPWEQHVAFLDSRRQARAIQQTLRESVEACRRHPAILCYAIGNEIPAPIVRWHGRDAIAHFLETLFEETKATDPDGLVTYVNYPTTEFLELPFLDLEACNVYLERQEEFETYLAKLHNLAGERPLLMAEVGLDSIRNGEQEQASSLDWQIRSTFAGGCAGVFVFKWTDEWHRGGNDILDWKFGLTTSDRVPKPALASVSRALVNVPFELHRTWPRVSVVVCTYNGASTIRDTLEAARSLQYPDYEVLVINDGSTDDTASIASEYDCRVVTTANGGLSGARNEGIRLATGEIIAYIDDDAYPDPHWLQYVADFFSRRDVAAVGGPNLLPPEDGVLAECISHAPGGPCHVLDTDELAEHIPGCNMAFRKSALEEVGGFDPQFHAAGDDVDLCWRLLERGLKIGYHPSAVVWHHRRPSIHRYWRQQFGYGKAEALLERKWPEKYNRLGHVPWSGRIYGRGLTLNLAPVRSRIYQGVWGQAPFQSVYQPAKGTWLSLPLMPEWYLTIFFLATLAALSFSWMPLSIFIPVLILALVAPIAQAVRSAYSAKLEREGTLLSRLGRRSLIAWLHLLQPVARLYGRLRHGLTVWRRRGAPPLRLPFVRRQSLWSETWHSSHDWLKRLERALKTQGAVVFRGGDFDRWDLEIKGGLFGSARVLMAVEEHGNGKQLVRFRVRPVLSVIEWLLVAVLGVLATIAFVWKALAAGTILALAALLTLAWQLGDCSVAMTSQERAFRSLGASPDVVLDPKSRPQAPDVPHESTATGNAS